MKNNNKSQYLTNITCFLFIIGINLNCYAAETLGYQAALVELEHIKDINNEDSQQAIELLSKIKPSISDNSPVDLRHKYLSVLISAQNDTGDVNAAWENALKLKQIGIDESDDASLADGLIHQGSVLVNKGEIEQAIVLFNKAIPIAESINDHNIAQYAYNNLALAENTIGEFQKSLSHFFKAVEHSELVYKNKERRMAVLLNNISLLYMSLKDPNKGLEYNQQAFKMAEKAGSRSMLATLALNRGYAYDDLGEFDKAYDSYLRGLTIAKETNSIRSEAVALINISDIFLRKKDYVVSAEYGKKALIASLKTGDQGYLATASSNVGMALAGQGMVKEGAEKVIAAINIFKASNSIVEVESTLGDLAFLYQNAGLYKEAMEAMQDKMSISEELYKSERDKAVSELQEKFNANERQKKIELLEKENKIKNIEIENNELQQRITLLIGILVFAVAVLVFLLYRKVRRTNEKLEVANSQLEVQSISDPLTGLLNRRSFLNLMESRNAPDDRRVVDPKGSDCLILLDIDNFKNVNDTYGHSAGDIVLVEISRRLKVLMREDDMVLRWGGEEFLIFARKPNPNSDKTIAKKILDTIGSTPISIGDISLNITVSIGAIRLPFCHLSEEEFNWERALQLADMALYLGKVHGRNRAYCINKLLAPLDEVRPLIEKDLAQAMEKELVSVEFVLGPTPDEK